MLWLDDARWPQDIRALAASTAARFSTRLVASASPTGYAADRSHG
ncbi:MAG TPA: hypothetical protein VGJ63_05415 [Micromonosporaceae bacterium]|jgi:hypothetical protein